MSRHHWILPIVLSVLVACTLGSCKDVTLYEGYCKVIYDALTDGVPDSIETRTYTKAGDLAMIARDSDADGVVDTATLYSYDSARRLITEEDVRGGAVTFRLRYVYDSAGLLITVEKDDDGDGQPEHVTSYSYDSSGNRTRVENREEGVLTSTETYTYHGNGAVASERLEDGDGQLNVEYLYNEDGLMTQWGWDVDGDGEADHGHVYVYDEDGKILTHTLYQDVPFGDPTPNYIETYTYDGSGYLIEIVMVGFIPWERIRQRTRVEWSNHYTEMFSRSYRDDGDTIDWTVHKIWDAEDNVILHEVFNGDGILVQWLRQAWENGNLVMLEQDDDLDGTVDRRTEYTYDKRGNIVRIAVDEGSPPDGVPDHITTHTYDKAGNLKKTVTENLADGVRNTTTYDYSCW